MPVQKVPQGFEGALAWVRLTLNKRVPLAALLLTAAVFLLPQVLPGLARRLMPHPGGAPIEGLELKDFIVKVKSDLASAEKDGLRKGERPLLQLEDVELVVNFVVQSKAEADVKLVTVNGSALAGLERTQRITLHLKPIPPDVVSVSPSNGPIAASSVIGPIQPPAGAHK